MLKQKKKLSSLSAATTVRASLLLLAVLLAGASGCVSSGSGGTTHHFIFGFGWVSVNNTHTNIAIVQKATAFGIYGGTGPGGKVGVGYMNRQTIEVVTNSNVVIGVDSKPGKQITITLPCAQHYP